MSGILHHLIRRSKNPRGLCVKCLSINHTGTDRCKDRALNFVCPTHKVNRLLCKCAYVPPTKTQNQASTSGPSIQHTAFDTEYITLVGIDGQQVSVLCTYDSFASQSSISLAMADALGLLKEDLGKISIQAFGGLIEMRGKAAFVRIK